MGFLLGWILASVIFEGGIFARWDFGKWDFVVGFWKWGFCRWEIRMLPHRLGPTIWDPGPGIWDPKILTWPSGTQHLGPHNSGPRPTYQGPSIRDPGPGPRIWDPIIWDPGPRSQGPVKRYCSAFSKALFIDDSNLILY